MFERKHPSGHPVPTRVIQANYSQCVFTISSWNLPFLRNRLRVDSDKSETIFGLPVPSALRASTRTLKSSYHTCAVASYVFADAGIRPRRSRQSWFLNRSISSSMILFRRHLSHKNGKMELLVLWKQGMCIWNYVQAPSFRTAKHFFIFSPPADRINAFHHDILAFRYDFELEKGAHVVDLSIETNGKKFLAEIKEKESAKDTYDDSIASGGGAYLLEQCSLAAFGIILLCRRYWLENLHQPRRTRTHIPCRLETSHLVKQWKWISDMLLNFQAAQQTHQYVFISMSFLFGSSSTLPSYW